MTVKVRIATPDPKAVLGKWTRGARYAKARLVFAMARFSHLCAEYLLADIRARLPSTPRWQGYSDALQVVQIATGGAAPAYGVVARLPVRRITQEEAPSALLYVRARARTKTDPVVEVLQKYSPWTWDTLPVPPPRAQTRVRVRRVRADEAEEVRALRHKQRRQWEAELSAIGVNPKVNRRAAVSAVTAEDDVAHAALQAEMGLSSEVPPHWRPAIRALKRSGYKKILSDPLLRRALTDPTFVPPPAPREAALSRNTVRQFAAFQRALGM